jgi:hypothetical protein
MAMSLFAEKNRWESIFRDDGKLVNVTVVG